MRYLVVLILVCAGVSQLIDAQTDVIDDVAGYADFEALDLSDEMGRTF